ncbi:MAG: YfhO family protein [Saprospiraceae bacterium]|nr:YfhO family protein [Candidatus Opimibacter iunctus]
MGFHYLLDGKPLNKLVLFGTSALLLCVLWYPYHVTDVVISADMQIKVSLFLIGYTALLWMNAEGMLSRLVFPALVSLVSIEALLFAWPAINDREPIEKTDISNKQYHFDDSMEAARQIKASDKELFYRVDKVYGSIKTGYNDGMVQGFFGTKTYQSHNHKAYVEFLDKAGIIDGTKEQNTRWLVGLSATNMLHGLFSIKYLMSNEASQEKVDPAIYTPIDTIGKTVISRNNYYIPFGIPIEQYLTEQDYDQLSVSQRRRSFYFSVVAPDNAAWKNKLKPLPPVLENTFFGTETRDRTHYLADAAMKMDYFSHNLIKGHIELQNNAMIFFSLPYDIGWKAKVDGVEKDLELIDFGFTGLLIEPGRHAIELWYEPPLSKYGWLGVLGALLCVGVLIRFRKSF